LPTSSFAPHLGQYSGLEKGSGFLIVLPQSSQKLVPRISRNVIEATNSAIRRKYFNGAPSPITTAMNSTPTRIMNQGKYFLLNRAFLLRWNRMKLVIISTSPATMKTENKVSDLIHIRGAFGIGQRVRAASSRRLPM